MNKYSQGWAEQRRGIQWSTIGTIIGCAIMLVIMVAGVMSLAEGIRAHIDAPTHVHTVLS